MKNVTYFKKVPHFYFVIKIGNIGHVTLLKKMTRHLGQFFLLFPLDSLKMLSTLYFAL